LIEITGKSGAGIVIRVIKEDRDEDIIDRAYRALVARGWDTPP
jgi:hypothetical protein